MKFGRKIQKLCLQALIKHRTTFCDHFKANGLVKRMVHMVKKNLQKYGLQKGHIIQWNI
jgi:hypothetical protein